MYGVVGTNNLCMLDFEEGKVSEPRECIKKMITFVFFIIIYLLLKLQKWFLYGKTEQNILFVLYIKGILSDARY